MISATGCPDACASAAAHYIGDRPGDSANTFFMPAYTVADIFATYDTKVDKVPVTYQFNVRICSTRSTTPPAPETP